jgi:hypothetical protein
MSKPKIFFTPDESCWRTMSDRRVDLHFVAHMAGIFDADKCQACIKVSKMYSCKPHVQASSHPRRSDEEKGL